MNILLHSIVRRGARILSAANSANLKNCARTLIDELCSVIVGEIELILHSWTLYWN